MTKFLMKTVGFCAILLLATSCEKYELDVETAKSFSGRIVVTNEDGSYFVDTNIRVVFSESVSKKGVYDIFLKKVKFAEKMPVRIDMTIPSVAKTAADDILGDGIVPWAMGGPFEKWTIRNLSGHITYAANGEPSALRFEMTCGDYPLTYNGIYTEE